LASGLKQRIVTALVIAALIVAVLSAMPPQVVFVAIAIVILAGAWEWAAFGQIKHPAGRAVYTVVVGAALYWSWQRTATTEGLLQFLQGACLWWVMAFLWILVMPKYGSRFSAVFAGLLVLVPAAIALARLAAIEPNGNWLLLYLLVLIAAADVGGYFGGRRFGRYKLAPAISPGKTWEGFAAGMLASVAVAAIAAPLFDQPVIAWVALGLLVALISVVGDLVESLFKRKVGLKDSSGLLPGHGGVLDRIDSHTAAAPVFLLGLYALGLAT
jgi:phosphatidate cytidylyltransferase